jgi:hypothetical protein
LQDCVAAFPRIIVGAALGCVLCDITHQMIDAGAELSGNPYHGSFR